MSSKSRGGLSKREMAAKQAGVKVNYSKSSKDQGKSVSTKSSSSSKSSGGSSKSSNVIVGKQVTDPNRFPIMQYSPAQEKQIMASQRKYYAANPDPKDYKEASKKKDKEYAQGGSKTGKVQPKLSTAGNIGIGSFNSSSQRDMAAEAMNRSNDRQGGFSLAGNIGIGKAEPQFNIANNTKDNNWNLLSKILTEGKSLTGTTPISPLATAGKALYDLWDGYKTAGGVLGRTAYADELETSAPYENQPYVQGGQFEIPTRDEANSRVWNPYTKSYQTQKEQSGWVDSPTDSPDGGMTDEGMAKYNYGEGYAEAGKNRLVAMGENPQDLEYNINQGINPYAGGQVAGAWDTNFNNDNLLASGGAPKAISEGVNYDVGNEQQMGKKQDKYFDDDEKDVKKDRSRAYDALSTLIDQMTTKTTSSFNEAKGQDLARLNSLFAGYGTADSEQRMQQDQRTNADYANRLGESLTELAATKASKAGDIENTYSGAMKGIRDQRRQAQLQVEQMMRQAAQQSFDNKYKMMSLGQSNRGNIRSSLSDLAGNWMNGVSDPYSKSGGREVIGNQMASLYGGNANQYSSMLPNGWESLYSQPQKSSSPQRSQNPMPEDDGMGGYVDGNPYSPTYGSPMELQ